MKLRKSLEVELDEVAFEALRDGEPVTTALDSEQRLVIYPPREEVEEGS